MAHLIAADTSRLQRSCVTTALMWSFVVDWAQSTNYLPTSCVTTYFEGFVRYPPVFCPITRNGELRTQKLKSHLLRTQSLNVLPLKPGVGQYIVIHATLTARDFFLAYFYTSGPFTCIFSKTAPDFSLCWLWLTHGSCVGPQNKIGHPAGCRFPCWVPAEYSRLKIHDFVVWWLVKWLTWR